MTTSRAKRARNAIAMSIAARQATTSSALTWKIGTLKPFAMSDECRVERPSTGSVVKPTWLLAIRCSVPPML